MKLFFAPPAASLAAVIVACEAGLALELVEVDLTSRTLRDGRRLDEALPKGAVPALELDDGSILTETMAILCYLSDQAPQSGLGMPLGGSARVASLEWLSFLASELHRPYTLLFWPEGMIDRQEVAKRILSRFVVLEQALARRPFVTGDSFNMIDAYAYALVRAMHHLGEAADGPFPALRRFRNLVESRLAVAAAIKLHDQGQILP